MYQNKLSFNWWSLGVDPGLPFTQMFFPWELQSLWKPVVYINIRFHQFGNMLQANVDTGVVLFMLTSKQCFL